MSIKNLFLLIAVFFNSYYIFSQNISDTAAPLKEVLLSLEKEHNVKFSYADESLPTKKLSINLKNSLEDNLKYIEENTLLSFKKISDRYYSITKLQSFFCGTIRDYKTNEVLKGATLIIDDKKGAVSSSNGFFRIKNPKQNQEIRISFVGYSTKTFNIVKQNNDCENIYLISNNSLLNEVQITDYLTSGISKKKDAALIIKPQSLGILPGLVEPDVLQSLQLFPGIQSPNETVAGIHIRGGTPDQNLILFDGIKIYNAAHFFGMISAFNPYITEKITVYKGAASPEYGNHVSGVIDIESGDAIAKKFSGGLGTNLTHIDFFTKIPVNERVGVNVSARRSFTDIVATETIDKISKKVFQNTIIEEDREADLENAESDDNFYFVDYNIKVNYKASDKDFLSVSHLFTKNQLEYEYVFDFDDGIYSTNDNLNVKNYGVNATWKRKFSEKVRLNTNAFHSKYDFNYDFKGVINFQNTDFIDTSTKKNSIESSGFKSYLDFNFNLKNSLKVGYEFNHNVVFYELGRTFFILPDFDYSFDDTEKTNNHALFSEYNFSNDFFNLHLGFRVNHFSLSNSTFFSPRITWKAALSDDFWIKSSYEVKQQNISQFIEFSTSDFGLENQIWALSDDDDTPILKSNQYSLGFVYNKNRWIFDVDFYNRNITGLTSFIDGFNNIQEVFSNGESTISGVDVLLKKSFNNYNSWFSYTYQNIDYTFENIDNGNSFPGNFDIRHNLTWTHNLKINKFNFSLGWNYRTGLPYTEPLGINNFGLINFAAKNKKRVSNYQRVDFSTTYSFNFSKNWKGKLGVSILNLFDKKNTLIRDHEANFDDLGNPFINRIDNVSQGITPNMVFRVMF